MRLRFGATSTIDFEPAAGASLQVWDGPRLEPIADVAAATMAALNEPLEFPQLRQAIVPGDKIVLALEPGVPRAAEIIAPIVAALLTGGAEADDITILRAPDDAFSTATDPRSALPAEYRSNVHLAAHHPSARADLAYLAADEHDQPIYMSRTLVDADFVVPIGRVRMDQPLGYGGAKSTLYPTFADVDAQQRCRVPAETTTRRRPHARRKDVGTAGRASDSSGQAAVSQHEAEHVAWLMGVLFTVQVVPGPGESVLHVLAGRLDSVIHRARDLAREAWRFEAPQRAKLVVAAIEGPAKAQTWDQVGRALAAAQQVVTDDGAIALCTELADAPGPALLSVAEGRDHRGGATAAPRSDFGRRGRGGTVGSRNQFESRLSAQQT